MILTRKSDNCLGTAFVQLDSAGDSKLIEQTLPYCFSIALSQNKRNFLGLQHTIRSIVPRKNPELCGDWCGYRRIFHDVKSPRQLKNWSIMEVQGAIASDHFY